MESPVERLYRLHAPFYDATRRWLLPGRRRAIERLGVQPGDRVLDFACGTGLNVPLLRKAGAGAILGIDFSEPMLARARRKYPYAEFRRADIRQVHVGAAPRVICAFGVSLVEDDPRETFRRLHRHVAPGGTLVILDFGEPRGIAGWILREWLRQFGARAPEGLEDLAQRLFESTSVEVVRGGVGWILGADRPRPREIPVESLDARPGEPS